MVSNGFMQSFRSVVLAIAVCAVGLAGCNNDTLDNLTGNGNAGENSTASQPASESSAASGSENSGETESSDANFEGNTYRAPQDAFEISFPDNYAKQPQEQGLTFVSSNGEFGGEVTYFQVDRDYTTKELEDLYKERYNEILDEVAWQISELQPDGSVRIDWRGRNAAGEDLDAIGYIEQHGDRVYILNLYGINEAYDIYLEDSQTIVGSYQVNREPTLEPVE